MTTFYILVWDHRPLIRVDLLISIDLLTQSVSNTHVTDGPNQSVIVFCVDWGNTILSEIFLKIILKFSRGKSPFYPSTVGLEFNLE